MMRYQHCVLLPISLFLIVAGVVSLIILGIGNLEPYTHTKDFRAATCTVVYSNLSNSVPCKKQDEDEPAKTLHWSWYPCLSVLVNYTELSSQYDILDYDGVETVDPDSAGSSNSSSNDLDGISVQDKNEEDKLVSAINVMLYDTYTSWSMHHTGEANSTCSIHVCHEDVEDNDAAVNKFFDNYGTVGYSFRCYFNPRNTAEVFTYIVTGNNVMHALVWPGLAIGFGLFLLVVVAFLSCEVWICRNPNRAQRRMQGQTYQLASYRDNSQDRSHRGWRGNDRNVEDPDQRSKRRRGDGNNNSRLPKLSAAADIIRKWSYRGRADRHSKPTDTNCSSQSYGGQPTRQWGFEEAETHFSTT